MSAVARNAGRAQKALAAGYTTRAMAANDAERVAEVHVRAWREAYVSLMPTDYLADLDVQSFASRWRDRLADPPSPGVTQLVGVNPSGDIVAFAVAGPSRDEDVSVPREVWAINVLAAAHGTGLADLMMAEVVGDRSASLWVLAGNVRARAFYVRHGFAPDGATKKHQPTSSIEVRLIRS
jgi:ribosomal protein S18 acetylase RimI-like enzyme